MTVAFETSHVTLHQGDVLDVLRQMPDESIDCCVTSPPYWGLRDYGVVGQIGLEATPDEYVQKMVIVFREIRRVLRSHGTLWLNLGDSYAQNGGPGWQGKNGQRADRRFTATRDTVPMREVMRRPPWDLKPKDLVGIPWRVALALQADGWYLRSDIIWAKPNPMPESVIDRPTKAHEYVFLLSKSERYHYDTEAIREDFASSPSDLRKMAAGQDRIGGKNKNLTDPHVSANAATNAGRKRAVGNAAVAARALTIVEPDAPPAPSFPGIGPQHGAVRDRNEKYEPMKVNIGRNARTVWTIATQPYPEAHFATFPTELPRRCIAAGTSEKGSCSECGIPWARATSTSYTNPGNRSSNGRRDGQGFRETGVRVMASGQRLEKQVETTGWEPRCRIVDYREVPSVRGGPATREPIYAACSEAGGVRPGVVLDPFAGSGTTLAVARDLGRYAIGIEINPEYVRLIEKRCAQHALDLGA